MVKNVKADMTFPANSDEEAYKKVADHFALLARLSGNGMDHGTKASWFEGDIVVTDQAEPAKQG